MTTIERLLEPLFRRMDGAVVASHPTVQAYQRKVDFLSNCDPLTGLYNRSHMERAFGRLSQPENLPLAVLMGDVNGLKIANDVFGYQMGDELLQAVAALLRTHCPDDAVIARWGGDEFLALLPHTPPQQAEEVLHRLEGAAVTARQSRFQCSLSLGCAVKQLPEESMTSVLRRAEDAMSHHKFLCGKSYRSTVISTLLTVLYENSSETEEHSRRLEEHCHLIGQALGASSSELAELSLLALLHDIGKVGVDPHILGKPGPLTESEWLEMKRHPEIGHRIALATPELAMVAGLILSHHERWDGGGYPQGLSGRDIPLPCRILAVADAFDAMTNSRVYREKTSVEAALAELVKHAGTQFDPAIVDTFLEHAPGL